jgi:two-component system sensor histidine kinase BaeS
MTPALDADRISVLVHEVRSPVAALSAIAETLADGELDRDARRTLIRLAVVACTGIERVVADVSVASIRFEPVDPGRLAGEVVAAARVRGAPVELRASKDVPTVRGDPARLRQVLDNLIANALVHGPSDDPVSVSVTVDAMVRIAVSDTGGGIPASELDRIFEPRVRLEPRASSGAGLGLPLARAIVEGHGGSLTVASTLGAGATFTLSLPVPEA